MKNISIILMLCLSLTTQNSFSQLNSNAEKTNNSGQSFSQFRIGGYGEALFQYFDYAPYRMGGEGKGSAADKRSEVSLPRFILAMDYKFSPSWILSSEIEFEYGGTGAGIEAEYGEGVEYEYEFEKGGEVALEQFHITKIFSKAISVRVGHFIVPVGITNSYHEPINFFGTSRPEGESLLIPCTWHETGLALLGGYKNFTYQAMVINGLDPYGFSSENWIKDGRQTKFEKVQMTNPAYAARVEYKGLKGARFGLSGYYGPKTAKNVTNPSTTKKLKGSVGIFSADAQYKGYGLTLRGNFLYGQVGDATEINKLRPNKNTGYSNTPVAKNAMTYFVEAGYNIGKFFPEKINLVPFVRYEYHNAMQNEKTGSVISDKRYKSDLYTVGINYFPLPNLVLKADYTHRQIDRGNFNDENTLSLAVAYIGWFFSK
ncbi:hypothetical protein M2138_000838 [Dysgonomonadaceae bacterium PH5-43]|nr:hypothetical protein [Dysgonomonadaceae bacterium PH5-43]